MMLNIDVMQKQAKIYVLERGVTIYEYRTERKEIVIYAVLRDIIGIISDTFIRDSYVDEKDTCILLKMYPIIERK